MSRFYKKPKKIDTTATRCLGGLVSIIKILAVSSGVLIFVVNYAENLPNDDILNDIKDSIYILVYFFIYFCFSSIIILFAVVSFCILFIKTQINAPETIILNN
jgi:hypothetical protein